MPTASPRSRGLRMSRLLAGLTAALLLITAPLAGAVAASAAPAGYTGTGSNEYSGDRILPLMTAGEPYTATLTGPQYGGPTSWCWSIESGQLPAGISMTTPEGGCAPTATFSGTPEAGSFSFELRIADTADESWSVLAFEGTIESGKSPTATTLTAPAFASYADIPLSATVAGDPSVGHSPTGTVEFYASGTVLIGSATLVDGVATTSASLDKTNAGGVQNLTARYLGDDDYQPSTSGSSGVRIHVPTANGTVQWNGEVVPGVTVDLLDDADPTIVVDTTVTDADGRFELSPGPITTLEAFDALYLLRVTHDDDVVVFHRFGGVNVSDAESAERTGPKSWKNTITIERRTPPVWTDTTLRTPRLDAAYSDSVAAATPYGEIAYTVSEGELPGGLTLNWETGALTGTPDACDGESCAYDFTLRAGGGYGFVTHRFTGTVGPAGVAPTWEDDELPDLRQGVAVTDAVLAVGDPTIVYTVTGVLPAGLALSASGALTGTPTAAGPYEFTITAENDFGRITADFSGVVEAAPDLGLELQFDAGTSIEDASSTITAEGLQVGSTYTLTMYSTPRVLYTGTVDGSGGFSWVVSLPADTPDGAHRLVLTGIAADGTPMSATAWFSLRSGRITAISYTGPVGGLAATGADPASGMIAAGLLVLVGAGALTVARRRRTS